MEVAKVQISHPEKIMYSGINVTKAEVAEYYNFISELMLPRIKDRPLSLKQYPGGIDKEGFFHKHAADFYPKYIKRFMFPTSHHGTVEMVGVMNASGLVYLAAQNTIEFHIALSTMKNIRCPDQMILDFDPSDDDFSKVRTLALLAKDILDQNGLHSFVKTTGSRGLHVHIPLKPKQEYEAVKDLAKQFAVHIQQQCPELATVEFRKNKRGTKVFIDYLRNDYSATAIAPYSLRPNKWAGIATPISWEELQTNKKLTPYTYNINNIRQRVKNTPNPWSDFK